MKFQATFGVAAALLPGAVNAYPSSLSECSPTAWLSGSYALGMTAGSEKSTIVQKAAAGDAKCSMDIYDYSYELPDEYEFSGEPVVGNKVDNYYPGTSYIIIMKSSEDRGFKLVATEASSGNKVGDFEAAPEFGASSVGSGCPGSPNSFQATDNDENEYRIVWKAPANQEGDINFSALCAGYGIFPHLATEVSISDWTTEYEPPSESPTLAPTQAPSLYPTDFPTIFSTDYPTNAPTNLPTQLDAVPTQYPTSYPTNAPTNAPLQVDAVPTQYPTSFPTSPTVGVVYETSFPTSSP